MTGKPSDRRGNSGKNKVSSVATPASSSMFGQEELLSTRHEILKEDHETLKHDYASLEERFKLVDEMNDMMKLHLQNQTKDIEAANLRLLKDLESERSEKSKMVEMIKRMESEREAAKEELKVLEATNLRLLKDLERERSEKDKMIEVMKRMESEREAVNIELRNKTEELKKLHLQNQAKVLEATNLRLLKDLERERSEKDKMIEVMKRMESEREAVNIELRNKTEELSAAKAKANEELKKIEEKYDELTKRYGEVEKECSDLKSIYDAENLTGLGVNNVPYDNEVIEVDHTRNDLAYDDDVIMVDEFYNVNNNTMTDTIVISEDESDGDSRRESSIIPESNTMPQFPLDIKQEEQSSNGAYSSQVSHAPPSSSNITHMLSPSSSSSSSDSDEFLLVQLPVKRSRDDWNKS